MLLWTIDIRSFLDSDSKTPDFYFYVAWDGCLKYFLVPEFLSCNQEGTFCKALLSTIVSSGLRL